MKYFLDCGSNLGQGFDYFQQKYGNEYNYILFEPNPNCYDVLIKKYSINPNVVIHNSAVYIDDTPKTFKFVTDYCVGGSIIENHNSAYNDLKRTTTVNCENILNIIETLANDNAEIIIKFDIESSEYDVLEKMIETGVILKIKKIYCEFHTQYMNTADRAIFIPREQQILEYIKTHNINFELWH